MYELEAEQWSVDVWGDCSRVRVRTFSIELFWNICHCYAEILAVNRSLLHNIWCFCFLADENARNIIWTLKASSTVKAWQTKLRKYVKCAVSRKVWESLRKWESEIFNVFILLVLVHRGYDCALCVC